MIKAGHSVMVVDNRTKQDITRFTLTQILFQKERDFLKSLPETTLETAIKQEKGLISNSLAPFGAAPAASNEAETAATAALVSPASTANN
jgi:hypothetical protein